MANWKTKILCGTIIAAVRTNTLAAEIDLAGNWKLVKADDQKVGCPIVVPGGVHTALLKAGLIVD